MEIIDFSLIIPMKNGLLHLPSLILNLSKILYDSKKFEIIFVDDNSTDGSEAFVRENMKSSNYSVIKSNFPGSGPGIARNTGITFAKGEKILFVDVDDLLMPDSLNVLSRKDNKIDDVIFFDFRTIKNNQEDKGSMPRKDHHYFESKVLINSAFLKNWTYQEVMFACYRRAFLKSNGIQFKSGVHEDLLFMYLVFDRMKSFSLVNDSLYVKNITNGSITQTISNEHLTDYLNAWWEIHLEISGSQSEELVENSRHLLQGFRSGVASRFFEITRLSSSDETQNLVKTLTRVLKESPLTEMAVNQDDKPNTLHEKVFSAIYKSLFVESSDNADLISKIESLSSGILSCVDLEHSLFFAPNEVRTCCKRFFVDGKIRGDVVLEIQKIKPNEKIEASDVMTAKRDLIRKINIGEKNDCDGCPFISRKNWNNFEAKMDIRYVSMEQHSVCNLRCTYCDDKYYGGDLPVYDVLGSLNNLVDADALSNIQTVVWGGGEPTLDPNFNSLVDSTLEVSELIEHRFLSNSKRYSQKIDDVLFEGKGQLVTSIDAGNPEQYKKVRGRSGFKDVLINLKRYAQRSPHEITVKYIFTDGNTDVDSINDFVREVSEYNLLNCIYQISFDFKKQLIEENDLNHALYLFAKLYDKGVYFVYLDDLFYLRLTRTSKSKNNLKEFILNHGATMEFMPEVSEFDVITMFGAGDQAERLLKTQNLSDRWPIKAVVDQTPSKAGTNFHGFIIKDLESIVDDNSKIYIAGVQSVSKMLKQLRLFNIESDRIIRGILI
jgi:glycosyltransferase involved in cell wall biosynthesis/MoaA/NifB/PqqE/SkfB family radical SAM enzyme